RHRRTARCASSGAARAEQTSIRAGLRVSSAPAGDGAAKRSAPRGHRRAPARRRRPACPGHRLGSPKMRSLKAASPARVLPPRPLSRGLLGRHAMHFAGLQIEAYAMDAVEIRPGHPDEAGMIGIVDRMNFAVLVDAGMAGHQAVFLYGLQLGVRWIAAVILALPFDHV